MQNELLIGLPVSMPFGIVYFGSNAFVNRISRREARFGEIFRPKRLRVESFLRANNLQSLARAIVLATCGIRSPVEAFENTQSLLLLLADSEEEE